jgi:hypothetical protein
VKNPVARFDFGFLFGSLFPVILAQPFLSRSENVMEMQDQDTKLLFTYPNIR